MTAAAVQSPLDRVGLKTIAVLKRLFQGAPVDIGLGEDVYLSDDFNLYVKRKKKAADGSISDIFLELPITLPQFIAACENNVLASDAFLLSAESALANTHSKGRGRKDA